MTAPPFVEARSAHLVLLAVAFGGHAIAFPLHRMTASTVLPPLRRGAVFGIVAAAGAGYSRAYLLSGGVMLVYGLIASPAIRPGRDARRLGPDTGRPHRGPREPGPGPQADGSKPLAQ